jgi:CheY-like chemotaxis protein
MMGGDIWVNSEAGQGSTFSFTFTAKVKTPEAADGAPLSFHGKTALLVEDVEINREIVMAMLEDTRLHIVCAANGLEAVDLFTSEPAKFDVIFMDINMPEMDGVEATRRIRAHGTPEGAQIPIIAMTANILPNEVKSYFAAGMTDHIGKPLDFDKLLSMIGRYLQ